jgi:predicted O-methyltransferase YrrM
MSPRTIGLNETLHRYVLEVGLREPDALRRVREETLALPGAHMQIAPEQGHFMALLARLTKSHRYLEIGTFTGYSAMALALALPPEGRVTTCEIDESFAEIALKHWQRGGIAHKINLKLGRRWILSIHCLPKAGRNGLTWHSLMPTRKIYYRTTKGASRY